MADLLQVAGFVRIGHALVILPLGVQTFVILSQVAQLPQVVGQAAANLGWHHTIAIVEQGVPFRQHGQFQRLIVLLISDDLFEELRVEFLESLRSKTNTINLAAY